MNDTSDTSDTTLGGNTLPQARARKWCLTINNYTKEELNYTENYCKSNCKHYVIGKEQGSKEHTPHLQIYIEYTNARSFASIKKVFTTAHIEAAKGSLEDNFTYCTKESDFLSNIKIIKKEKILRTIDTTIFTLYDWQKSAYERFLLNDSDRKIYWYVDPEGNKGKSRLAKYLIDHVDNVIYFTGGKNSDICSQILLWEKGIDGLIFDFTRDKETYISYSAIEACKNGLINSPKYKGGFKSFESPNIIVFSNFYPDKKKLSEDRWEVTQL